jgi:hypothetical protein
VWLLCGYFILCGYFVFGVAICVAIPYLGGLLCGLVCGHVCGYFVFVWLLRICVATSYWCGQSCGYFVCVRLTSVTPRSHVARLGIELPQTSGSLGTSATFGNLARVSKRKNPARAVAGPVSLPLTVTKARARKIVITCSIFRLSIFTCIVSICEAFYF